jgi:hypothetical protein
VKASRACAGDAILKELLYFDMIEHGNSSPDDDSTHLGN